MLQRISSFLAKCKKNNLYRTLNSITSKNGIELTIDQKSYLNFSSNNYLGLAEHPDLAHASCAYTKMYGTGSAASRLVTGNLKIFQELEEQISTLYHSPCLLFNSGYQANLSLLPALFTKETAVFSDKSNHNSILQGIKLSDAKQVRYRHSDLNHLEDLLKKSSAKERWIATESLFSMDGDLSNLKQLIFLKQKYNCYLFLDDSHAFGVYGVKGLGLGCLEKGVDLIMSGLGKAAGSFGAFAICDQKIKEYLIQKAGGFIYSTALPPGVIGSLKAAFDVIPKMDRERRTILETSDYFREELVQNGFSIGRSNSHIIPVYCMSEAQALETMERLKEQGIWATAIRPPTVSRPLIRFSVTCRHTREHVDRVVALLKER